MTQLANSRKKTRGIEEFPRRARKTSAGKGVIASRGGAEVAEDEIFGHAVVQLSHENLLVKEKRAHWK